MQVSKVRAFELKVRQNVNFFGEWYIVSAILPVDVPSKLKLCLTHPCGSSWDTVIKTSQEVTCIINHEKVEE